METPAFFVALYVHLTCLILAFGAVMVTDHYGVLWMRHKTSFARMVTVADRTQKLIWIGWFGMIASGIPLLVLKAEIDNLMIWKLVLVGAAGLNGLALHRILGSLRRLQDADAVPTAVAFRLGLSTAVSQLAWWGAMTIGFLHRHVWDVIEWPARPWLWVGVAAAIVLAAWGAGELVLRRRPSKIRVEAPERAPRRAGGPGPTLDPLGKQG